MADKISENKVPLLENPAHLDSNMYDKIVKEVINNPHPIQQGDVRLESWIKMVNGVPTDSQLKINIYTFKPGEEPEEFIPGFVPYPISRDLYIYGNELLGFDFDYTGKVRKSVSRNIGSLDSTYMQTWPDEEPVKERYTEHAPTNPNNTEGSVVEDKILDPERDLPGLDLDENEEKRLYKSAIDIRKWLAINYIDQPDPATGLTDPRLRQIDNLINYLGQKITFKINK
jgi:hypothetical protein